MNEQKKLIPFPVACYMLINNDKNIAVVCNPLAGAGRAVDFANRLCEELKKRQLNFTLFANGWPDRFDGYTEVYIAGGDGTLNFFANKYPGIKLPIAIFNAGTGNDFHWLLYGQQTFEEQLQTVLQAIPKPIDLGRCNEYYFVNGVGVGFEGEVAKALTGQKKQPGKTSFLWCVIRKIFSYRSKPYTISSDKEKISGKKLLVDIANGRRAGGGFHIAPESAADDGLFDVVIADALTPLQRLRYLPVIEKGRHLKLYFIHHYRTSRLRIESNTPIQFHLDGEYREAPSLDIDMLAGQLLFLY